MVSIFFITYSVPTTKIEPQVQSISVPKTKRWTSAGTASKSLGIFFLSIKFITFGRQPWVMQIVQSKCKVMCTGKIIIVTAMTLLLSSATASANEPVFLFDHFVRGTFLTDDSAMTRTEVNIDIDDLLK